MKFRVGQKVEWKWGQGVAEGKVSEVHQESVSFVIKGKKITRHGTAENPAYLVVQEKGTRVLKLGSELHKSERVHGWV